MSAQQFIVAQLVILFIVVSISGVLSVKRDHHKHSVNEKINQTDATLKERDGRQFAGGYGPGFPEYGLTGFGGPIEAIIIGLLVVLGLGIVGIPIFLLFISLFGGLGGGLGTGGIGGLNLVPTTTTTVAGRRRRDLNSLFPEVNPLLQKNLINIFENFIESNDKIKVIEKLLDSMVGRN